MIASQYILRNRTTGREFCFKFDLNGVLIGFERLFEADVQTMDRALECVCLQEQELKEYAKRQKTMELQPVPVDLSFERFWEQYDYKIGAKERTRSLWNKLSVESRVKALHRIGAYKQWSTQKNYDLAYPERYLSKSLYEGEFK